MLTEVISEDDCNLKLSMTLNEMKHDHNHDEMIRTLT